MLIFRRNNHDDATADGSGGRPLHQILSDAYCIEDFKYNEQMTFVETVSQKKVKRNPHVFEGQYITVTQRDDGTYRPDFRPVYTGGDFSVEHYAAGVANELLWALEGLVGEE